LRSCSESGDDKPVEKAKKKKGKDADRCADGDLILGCVVIDV
jgi:hypothetical protein